MNDDPTTIFLVWARAIHIGACLLVVGVWTFDRLVVAALLRRRVTVVARPWERIARWLMLPALPSAALSGLVWFALVTINMSGLPLREAMRPPVLRLVWSQTQFGEVCKLRVLIWCVSALLSAWVFIVPAESRIRSVLVWLAAIFAALLLGSLAWTGHGRVGNPAWFHLLADSLHLVVAGIWPTGLLPLALLLQSLRRESPPDRWPALATVVTRFSVMSLASVGLLAATGLINSFYLLRSIFDLLTTPYGRLLLVKVSLFCLMVGIGAFNLLGLKPRILAADAATFEGRAATAASLRFTVVTELAVAIVVVLAVAVLGIIPPP